MRLSEGERVSDKINKWRAWPAVCILIGFQVLAQPTHASIEAALFGNIYTYRLAPPPLGQKSYRWPISIGEDQGYGGGYIPSFPYQV